MGFDNLQLRETVEVIIYFSYFGIFIEYKAERKISLLQESHARMYAATRKLIDQEGHAHILHILHIRICRICKICK